MRQIKITCDNHYTPSSNFKVDGILVGQLLSPLVSLFCATLLRAFYEQDSFSWQRRALDNTIDCTVPQWSNLLELGELRKFYEKA